MKSHNSPTKQPRRQPDPSEPLRGAARMLVAMGRQNGANDSQIRARVKHAITEALEGTAPVMEAMDLGDGPTMMVSSPGLFRLVLAEFELDHRNQAAQESWFAVVIDELEKALYPRDDDFPQRGPLRFL